MRIKWNGADEARDLAYPGGVVVCPRGKWVDVDKEAAAAGVAPEHLLIVARSVAGPDWEFDAGKSPKSEATAPPKDEDQ